MLYPYIERRDVMLISFNEMNRLQTRGYVKVSPKALQVRQVVHILATTPMMGAIDVCSSFKLFTGNSIYMGPHPNEVSRGLHAVMIIGVGQLDNVMYCIIKNIRGALIGASMVLQGFEPDSFII